MSIENCVILLFVTLISVKQVTYVIDIDTPVSCVYFSYYFMNKINSVQKKLDFFFINLVVSESSTLYNL